MKNQSPFDLSIIIISFNTKAITLKCLETIDTSLKGEKSFTTEVILYENASSDDTGEAVQTFIKNHPPTKNLTYKFFQGEKNLGFGGGNNEAVKKSNGKYVLFLNSDIEVLDDAIKKIFGFFISSENDFQILGAKLFNPDMSIQTSCGPEYDIWTMIPYLFLRGDHFGLTRWSPDKIKEVDWVMGAAFMMSRQGFDLLGGFDEKIFMYAEEIDLMMRAKKMGMKIGFFPASHFIHLGSASSGSKKKPIINTFVGFDFLYKKHYSSLERTLLGIMLKSKSYICIVAGKILNKPELIETYVEALKKINS